MATIAERIRQALELRNLKQADLVEKTGIGKSSISTYISGEYEPKQKNIYKIAKALDVNEAWLIGYDVPRERKTIVNADINDIEALRQRYGDKLNEHFIDFDGSLIFIKKNNEFDRLRGELILAHYQELNPTGQDAIVKIMYFLKQLNSVGQEESVKRIEELTHIGKYTNSDNLSNDYLTINAAHSIEGASEEDKQHDEDIMNDENF